MSAQGVIDIQSKFSVSETIDRLESLLRGKGIKVFARIDQRAEAQVVGLSMPRTELIIFGDPKAGTPLMVKYPSIAIDLPLKAVAWESSDDKVWLSYNAPEYLKTRHHLDAAPFSALGAILLEAAAH